MQDEVIVASTVILAKDRARGKQVALTVEDLRSGRRAEISTREYARLKGCSPYTLERKRWLKKGIPYKTDPETGRVSYRAEDVLKDLDGPTRRSTCEYDTSANVERLTKARQKLAGGNQQ